MEGVRQKSWRKHYSLIGFLGVRNMSKDALKSESEEDGRAREAEVKD